MRTLTLLIGLTFCSSGVAQQFYTTPIVQAPSVTVLRPMAAPVAVPQATYNPISAYRLPAAVPTVYPTLATPGQVTIPSVQVAPSIPAVPSVQPIVTYRPIQQPVSPMVQTPLVQPATSLVPPVGPIIQAPVIPVAPIVIAPRYVPGQPIRNVLRAIAPY